MRFKCNLEGVDWKKIKDSVYKFLIRPFPKIVIYISLGILIAMAYITHYCYLNLGGWGGQFELYFTRVYIPITSITFIILVISIIIVIVRRRLDKNRAVHPHAQEDQPSLSKNQIEEKDLLVSPDSQITKIRRTQVLLYTILFPVIVLFVGLIITFVLTRLLPGDPVGDMLMAMGITNPTPGDYNNMVHQLGFDQPVIVQFFRFIGEMFSGQWGTSTAIARGQPVWGVVIFSRRLHQTLDLILIPCFIGVWIGILISIRLNKSRNLAAKKISSLFLIAILATPIFFMGMIFQVLFNDYRGFTYFMFEPEPPFITGFYIIDAILSGEWYLMWYYIPDIFLPATIIFILVTTLTIRQITFNYRKSSENVPFFSNSLKISMNYSWILSAIVLIEITYSLRGLGYLFINSLDLGDFYVFQSVLFIFILIMVIILAISNSCYCLYHYFVHEKRWKPPKYLSVSDRFLKKNREDKTNNGGFNSSFLSKLRNPFTIIGLSILVCAIVFSIFPNFLISYSIEELFNLFYRKDATFILLLLAIPGTLTLGFIATLIGAGFGVIFGFISDKYKRIKISMVAIKIILFIFPAIVIPIVFSNIFGLNTISILLVTGLLLIPLFTRVLTNKRNSLIILNSKQKFIEITKRLLIYLPLGMGIAVLLIESIAYLGFSDPTFMQLGRNIYISRNWLHSYPWASLWPGFAVFCLVLGCFLLHYGLKEPKKNTMSITNVKIK